ncbi:hypothetical protein WICPIJ_002673 [Wickerhamomyces pijperi]|uniref:Uncharacterized protein n=1 Tax=Wickerhamomyces pijperi TaxID=599730 RepID=A0A9P8TPE0_WICPI|nr:hypothetical protein WICPIJ_002673 [Wickerhamomyces pijperi]
MMTLPETPNTPTKSSSSAATTSKVKYSLVSGVGSLVGYEARIELSPNPSPPGIILEVQSCDFGTVVEELSIRHNQMRPDRSGGVQNEIIPWSQDSWDGDGEDCGVFRCQFARESWSWNRT